MSLGPNDKNQTLDLCMHIYYVFFCVYVDSKFHSALDINVLRPAGLCRTLGNKRAKAPLNLLSNRAMKNGQVMLYDLNYLGANLC